MNLIHAINEALEYVFDRETFIMNMELEGCEVIWTDARKHIPFITPEGRKCRGSKEPDEGWMRENQPAPGSVFETCRWKKKRSFFGFDTGTVFHIKHERAFYFQIGVPCPVCSRKPFSAFVNTP